MTAEPVRVRPPWLGLREPADAAARSFDLVEDVRRQLPDGNRTVIHDVGCGTGSMARWLAPRLTGTQHWVLYDGDADLLAHAAKDMPGGAADGAAVTIETRQHDITRPDPGDLAGVSLITASALLDMMTADELEGLVTSCADAGSAVLVTISVVGRVHIAPADRLDDCIADSFNAHQRRTASGRRLLGADAVGSAVDAFPRLGAEVLVGPSPWRLGAARTATAAYPPRCPAEAAAGRLSVTVHHKDLLALPLCLPAEPMNPAHDLVPA